MWRRLGLGLLLLIPLVVCGQEALTGTPTGVLERKFAELFDQLPPIQRHIEGLSEAGDVAVVTERQNYRQLAREKADGTWFAAVVATTPGRVNEIKSRFQNWKGFIDFVMAQEVLVELWAYGEEGMKDARRVPATEVAEMRRQPHDQPLFVTLTYREPGTGQVVTDRVEFGFGAAEVALAGQQAYSDQRQLQSIARRMLGTRRLGQKFDALAQWEALQQMREEGLAVLEPPPRPGDTNDLFVAVEYEVNNENYLTRIVRFWRESEVRQRVQKQPDGTRVQVLTLKRRGEGPREARAFRVRGVTDELEPVPAPLAGQDAIELRVVNSDQADPRRWNVLEFGEPALVRQAAIAEFSLVNAYMDKHRKEVGLTRSKLDLFAEPVFAGLNIGCGLAAVGFPVGEAARLGYNAAITPFLIPPVPSVKQMRELVALLAAKESIPELKTKPTRYLDESDYQVLKRRAASISQKELDDFLARIQEEDIRAMLRLAKMAHLDQEVTNLLNILAGAAKVSGWSDEPGLQRDLLNSVYFSLNGDINLKNLIAVGAGAENATPLSGASLHDLAEGKGPLLAWLQYLDVTVDVRAVANTVSRLLHPDLADKEMKMPFPYATRMSDIAAYEIRIFGYPLFIYYKRGLMKDDYHAFQNDYAYGLITTKIVEHFATREEMDAEIRAGRMMPLGFVRVPDGVGGWKESNLAVFAHRIPQGRYAGKTAIIIYGLKAYGEQSQLMMREYRRLKQFEQALEDGGVIEQLIEAEQSAGLSSLDFEPIIHVGTNASTEVFSPLLGNLLEWRRHLRRSSFGLPKTQADETQVEVVRRYLESRRVPLSEMGDPLLGVDKYNSAFLYRRQAEGGARTYKMVNIPSRADIVRELAKAAEGKRVEARRRECVLPSGQVLALLNEARLVGGHYEVGPLLRDEEGRVDGVGVVAERVAVDRLLAHLDRLPVAERASIYERNFASALVELPPDGARVGGKAFLTLEFPLDATLSRAVTNPITGQEELRTFSRGRLVRTVTSRAIVEMEYDDRDTEVASRMYQNRGTLSDPVKGTLLESTRTIEVWSRPAAKRSKAYQPRLTKLRANYITGAVSRETYGAFPLPVSSVDDLFIVSNRFNPYGLFAGASVWNNGQTKADLERPWAEGILHPIGGEPRFELVSAMPRAALAEMVDGSSTGYKTSVTVTDRGKHLTRQRTFDDAAWGRCISETWSDALDGGEPLKVQIVREYEENFHFGLVPRVTRKLGGSGSELLRVSTTVYDPVLRRLTALEQDYTGASRTKVWDYRWESPVSIQSAGRRTDLRFNREETTQTSTTVASSTGEQLSISAGEFDTNAGVWRIARTYWYRPGVTNRLVAELRSAYGVMLSTHTGSNLLSQPYYDSNGIERSNCVFRLNAGSGKFDTLHRTEDGYVWRQGRRGARVRTYVDGAPYDEYQIQADELGRIFEDAIREISGVRLATAIQYDGVTDRVLRAEEKQNANVRTTRHPQPEQHQPGGTWQLPVVTMPRWGLMSTQLFLLGDVLGRPISNRLENGDRIEVRQWYPETAIPRISELVKPDGRVVERFVTQLNAGNENAAPYDRTKHYRLSFWGAAGLAAEEAYLRGTDLPLFIDLGEERICFDLRQSYKAPLFGIDRSGCSGVTATVLGTRRTNVLSLFRARIEENLLALNAGTNEPVLLVEKADVRGFFFHRVHEQKLDRSGRLLEELISRTPNTGGRCYSDETVFDAPRMTLARFKPEYQSGWFVEVQDPINWLRQLVFTNRAPPGGIAGYAVNQGGFPDTVTLTEGKVFGSTGESEAARFRDFFFRKVHNVRFLEQNAHMPDLSGFWSASTRTDYRPDGSPLFDLDLIFDAQGRLRAGRADKQTSQGGAGTRISYQVVEPEDEDLKNVDYGPGTNMIALSASGRTNFAGSDFLYLYATGIQQPRLVVKDASGRVATVHAGDSDYRTGLVPQWRIHPMHVRWLPDDIEPRQGTELLASPELYRSGKLLSVSVHDLARAGLNVSALSSFALNFTNSAPGRLSISPVHVLDRLGPMLPDANPREYTVADIQHSSGLRTVVTADRARSDRDFYTGQKMDVLVEFNGLPVATARARGSLAAFPHLLWLDNSDPDLARPLYALSERDGHFLEYYQMLRPGDAHLYVAPQTFEAPRLEIYRADVLHDELYPGFVGYGRDYQLTIPLARSRSLIGQASASLRQRVEANPFRFGASRALQRVAPRESDQQVRRFNYLRFQEAETRAKEITQQPTPAQILAGLRDLPWNSNSVAQVPAVPVDWKQLRLTLSSLHRSIDRSYPTGLIPTSRNTEAERFVDTVKEADLIVLAVKIGEPAMAAELLEFYRNASHGGQEPVLASYDAQTGTAMERDVRSRRAGQSTTTAEAQLAVADAAFYLGFSSSLETDRTRWLSFGRHLLSLALAQFRLPAADADGTRGIAEFPVHEVRKSLGVTIWPDANVYSLASNSRAYILLKRLVPLAGSHFQDPEWRVELQAALAQQEAFLKKRVLPEIERTGVVPTGLFDIQDIEQQSTAVAVQRWTTAEDWLLFLDAAVEMGLPQADCRQWLNNLARVHGVSVKSVWGLDWRLALARQDTISPELTARFMRVAHRLEARQAEAFAARNLNAMRRGQVFPVAVTEEPREHALAGSKDFTVLPWIDLRSWPPALSVFRDLRETEDYGWDMTKVTPGLQTAPVEKLRPVQPRDLTVFIIIAAGVYLCVLGSALFWWGIRAARRRRSEDQTELPVVPEAVMARGEERWAKRVLGMTIPGRDEFWRFSNAPVEQNFLVQLRAAYKLVLEWRRLENGWEEQDEKLVEHTGDAWINGADEFGALIGIYMRAVIKVGAKDGLPKTDVLAEHEDSNHIWARLTLFFSEHLWSLRAAVHGWKRARGGPEEADYRNEIQASLEAMGIRERTFEFDARQMFNYPANPHAMDLLIIQDPGRTVADIMGNAALKLDIPLEHIRKVIGQYKQFKNREKIYPLHPYLVEFAKELPHFVLLGLGAVVWYNQTMRDSPIVEYLKDLAAKLALRADSLFWAVPLAAGMSLTVIAHLVRAYRFEAAIRPREKPGFWLDATVTSLFVKRHEAEPGTRTGRWRDPNAYERWAWVLRALGYFLLAVTLFRVETPSFGTFLIVKGIFGMLALAEMAGVILPLAMTGFSKFVQDRAQVSRFFGFLNRLNLTATRPASPMWLSIKYHAQPSMPTGTNLGLAQLVAFYFLLAAAFLFGAGYLCQQIFPLWFTETYLQGNNLKLVIGGVVFGVTMVLLRYGIFLLFTSVASLLAAFPVLSIAGWVAIAQILFTFWGPSLDLEPAKFLPAFWGAAGLMLLAAMFETRLRLWWESRRSRWRRLRAKPVAPLDNSRLGVVYMSGDDLSGLKLTPDVLMSRWALLRDRLDSNVLPILGELAGRPNDETLKSWFEELYASERAANVTLWHPAQLHLLGTPEARQFGPDSGLNISVANEEARQRILAAWHLRRWLACMMSTAGHSQDTGVNLVDMALRFHQEGLSERVAFYLINNKYDNNPNNRPSQVAYDRGELAHRSKLARLLCAVAPGARAYCLQNWTPFGFKSGGLTGMDLVYEESLRISNLLLLDRNATVHDLDAFMLDVRDAMSDPRLVIVIPGRSTTNTLTSIGQGSQLVEEGHRSYLRGILSVLGGSAGEAVGTGWGNLLACFYGRVQHALLSARGRKMALTSRMLRGTSFVERTEGLIGFGPHAVGISEDIWAVVQAMNTALGLGLRPRFALSRAIWHKLRETWSHAEWLSSFPRWAGGYYQMVHDPIMQRIYDFGPQSVFARELRSNSGRSFFSAPVALLSILLMPLAIIFDVSPFVQTLVVLWNCGFVLNQVLTLHALTTYIESHGFHRGTALLGAAVGALCSWLFPAALPYGPGLVLTGLLVGGFFVGFSRWLITRVRDLVLFGPQLVLHALAQTVRLSLEFTVSGTSPEDARHVSMSFRSWAGPREDRPLDAFAGFINLRTVIWGFGFVSMIFCLVALTRLDMLNVLLLLPSLLFSISTLAGPFLMTPAAGRPLGAWGIIPRLLGWGTAAAFYTLITLCAAQGRWGRWLALAAVLVAFGVLLKQALRYVPFRGSVRRCRARLVQLLKEAGVEEGHCGKISDGILQTAMVDQARIPLLLGKAGIPAEAQASIVEFTRARVVPLLKAPVLRLGSGILSRSRWAVEWTQAFVIGLLVLLWFVLVPVPALIVFTAGSYPDSYRFTLSLGSIMKVVGTGILVVLVAWWLARLLQWLELHGFGSNGLRHAFARCFTQLKGAPHALSAAHCASAFALLTDAEVYIDQRSYAYARRSIEAAERLLHKNALSTLVPLSGGATTPGGQSKA